MRWLLGFLLVAALAAGAVLGLNLRDEDPIEGAVTPAAATTALIARGAYLARAGNCMGCHTERGGAPYAGGRGIDTPFGTVYATNLTPDPETGLGRWTPAEFWRALHNGRSRDGHLLYPVFPYPNYTRLTRPDADALFAYLHSLPAVAKAPRAHALRFPFDTQAALAVWRALYFEPGRFVEDPRQPADWNRGAYLVQGLGHCNACHGERNALGATRGGTLDLGGGLIPMQNWYAPSLADPHEAGVSTWPAADVVALLKTGVNGHASVLGPMAEVVRDSTQYLSDADLAAMTHYLQALPPQPSSVRPDDGVALADAVRGRQLYADHCAACHGEQGEGVRGIYPALAGNRAVTLANIANLVRVLTEGGFAPATPGNPRPFGMPPFATTLSDDDIADVLSHVRTSWGNQAPAVSAFEVSRYRGQH
ncbi:MAG: cytochrome c [Rhizobacter sp.]|nr:cytochrome c [Rhizobacter sp.]